MRASAAALLLALGGVLASGSALALKGGVKSGGSGGFNKGSGHVRHHGSGHHHKHGVTFIGIGFAYPWYYSPPYYYPAYPQPVAYPAQPVTYIEQGGAAPEAVEPAGWWYYCESSRTYYPYVKECPSGWQRVPALPPPPQ